MADKLADLLARVDLNNPARPDLAGIAKAKDPAAALLAALDAPPRGRYRFEHERKADILAFVREHYAGWRKFDTAPAEKFVNFDLGTLGQGRITADIVALGRAWWATGDEKYGKALGRIFGGVKTGDGFNWGSFNATQVTKDMDAYFMLKDCPGFSQDDRIAFFDHLSALADDSWDTHTATWSQLSLGPEGHNWYIHGMEGLPLFGAMFPEFKRSRYFIDAPWSMFEEHLRGHIKADGGARETTLGYQMGTTRILWELYLHGVRNGIPMASNSAEILLRTTRFLLELASPEGTMPAYGDTAPHTDGVLNCAAMAAAVTGDNEMKWYAEHLRQLPPRKWQREQATTGKCASEGGMTETPGQIPESAFWRVGLGGAATYAAARARNPHRTSVLMDLTGYAAMRDGDGIDANYMAICAAARGPIVTSHGHNEIFATEVHADGRRFIGELGPAGYGESVGRDYDMTTAAHNTLEILGMEQVPLKGEWRWHGRVRPQIQRWISEPTHDFFDGAHEGYYKYQVNDVLHRRKVLFIKKHGEVKRGYWVVFDWMLADQTYDYRLNFHGVRPGKVLNDYIRIGEDGGTQLAIVAPTGDPLKIEQLQSAGHDAYISEKKLEAEWYPWFGMTQRAASHCFVTVLMPVQPGEDAPKVERLPAKWSRHDAASHDVTAVRIAHREGVDTVCISHKDHDDELTFGNEKAWGWLALRRVNAAGQTVLNIEHVKRDGIAERG
jgi:hypothetical protein